ncbi:MAG: thioredoxin family protein [Rhodocyclaceae bacterium]|jgi:thiol:disulfide interchange protein DsbD|nr:thioredoxin family protein [Rhodocyclaceae bacterium]MCA3047501.1 thioredoxin family protein [Rhodocyclaceae bacterium]MCA3051084.1 thioredoxin family protein [Rhodocyclaceae bacterium]MCA3067860.1 thioredoxin family protein [Rhodocyclaceae bacterium]
MLASVLALGISSLADAAEVVKTPHVEAQLVARHTTFQPGKPIEAALRLKIIDHWHTYWRNPGDSGLPTKLKWTLPEGFTAGEIQWPYPKKLPLGPLMNFGYEGEVLHLVNIQTPATFPRGDKVTLKAKADWLVCADVCIPEEGVVSLSLVATDKVAALDSAWEASFARTRASLPDQTLRDVSVAIEGMIATIKVKTQAAVDTAGVAFYPLRDDVMANASKQIFSKTPDGFALTVALADPKNNDLKTLDGVLVAEEADKRAVTWGTTVAGGGAISARAVSISAPVVYLAGTKASKSSNDAIIQAKTPANPRPDLSLALALLLALLGGLVLNLMPCVFPVLGIKVMGFVENAHGESRLLRRQGAAYFVGVLLSFMALAGLMLALRGAGQSIGWGFQMQEPLFVGALAVLFFVMALNLSGVFEFGTSIQAVAGDAEQRAQSNPLVGALISGVLATVVATPCMAPGLGASVGFTLSQSAPIALLVFVAIAVGLALPVSLLSFFPALLRYLPKPGAWMDTFKQVMAFPLYGTVVWLVWILGAQTGNDGVAALLAGLTVLALAGWVYGRMQTRKPVAAVAVGLALAAAGLWFAWTGASAVAPTPEPAAGSAASSASPSDWVPFSTERIAALRNDGKSVFVDFTATWCITCQVNKRVALNDEAVVAQMKTRNVVRMKADWTRKDPAITAALAAFGRNGVPLYVLYPPRGEPVILPELLTPTLVLDAISAMP